VADASEMLEQLPDGLIVVRDGEVVIANARARALLGGPDPRGRVAAEVLELRNEAGRSVPLPDSPPTVGHRYAERVLHVSVPGGTRPVACSAAWRDGSLMILLRGAGRREALGRSQADVVATVAHEIRAPLTSVKGFTSTLLARWDRFSDDQKHAMLETVEADADRVTRLLTDLLDIARIEAGRVKLRRRPLDPLALLREVVAKAGVRAPDVDITVTTDGQPPELLADADKLEQVVTNLVDNAILHGRGAPVRCAVVADEDRLRITIADDGPGIPDDVVPTLFTKFGRGRSSHRAGTGLGLFLSKGLVEAHGGRIWFDEDPPRGTVVHVELPRDGDGADVVGSGA